MNWKQPITAECLKMDTATRLIFMEILIHCRNEDMEYPEFIQHGKKQISYQLKRGQALFLSGNLKKIGITRNTIQRSLKLLTSQNSTINMTINRQPFGFIVSVLNYDELIKMTINPTIKQQSNNNQTAIKRQPNNKSVKSGEIDKTVKIDKQDGRILEILNFFNETFKKSNKSCVSWEDNAKYWLEIYTLEEVKQAITNLNHPEWFAKKKPSLELMFRKSNKNGKCDYIQSLLDLPERKNNNPVDPDTGIEKIPTTEELINA